jgi:hypothetical protein
MHICVETSGDPVVGIRPALLRFDGREVAVAEGVDQWWGEDDRYFKLRDGAGNLYVIRLDETRDAWTLVMFQTAAG